MSMNGELGNNVVSTADEFAPVKNSVVFKPRRPNPRKEIEDELELELECLKEIEYDDLDL